MFEGLLANFAGGESGAVFGLDHFRADRHPLEGLSSLRKTSSQDDIPVLTCSATSAQAILRSFKMFLGWRAESGPELRLAAVIGPTFAGQSHLKFG
jgi:hypothetical protein